MSGNTQTINSSKQEDNLLFEEWHKEHHKTTHHGSRRINLKGVEHLAVLIGAPNVGKSTFFNKVTRSTAVVSNIDRMTVEDTIGKLRNDKSVAIVDLPGLYNLSHPLDEEKVVAHEIFGEHYHKIINIVGSQSIKRDLILTLQCLETGMMSTLIFNMIDEINNDAINFNKLSKLLNNVKVVPTQANRRIGVKIAEKSIKCDDNVQPLIIKYSIKIENLIAQLIKVLPNRNVSTRFYALMLLEGNQYIKDELKKYYPKHWKQADKILHNVIYYDEIMGTKKDYIENILKQCINKNTAYVRSTMVTQHKMDRIFLNKWVGIPLFFLMMIAIYFISFGPWTGGGLQSLIADDLFDKIIITGLHNTQGNNATGIWIGNLFIDGVLSGFFAVLSFIPVITILFILVNLINQIGVISRVSVLLDEILAKFGISGRSVVGLLTGFGCAVPAVMMARSSNSKKERIISILIAPFIACSAKVIVFAFICNLISANWGWSIMIALMISSGFIALFMGLVFSKIMFRNQRSFFLVEMVNWRKPDIVVIIKSVWLQLKEFIKKAGVIIVGISLIIWLFLHVDPTLKFSQWYLNENIEHSLLAYASRGLQYIFVPIGFGNIGNGYLTNDGWKLTASLLSALPAKEIAITNINMLYGIGNFNIPVPEALGYLMMVMLMMPCGATLAVVKKEGGWKILRTSLISSFLVAYVLAGLIYWIAFVFSLI